LTPFYFASENFRDSAEYEVGVGQRRIGAVQGRSVAKTGEAKGEAVQSKNPSPQ
jgi:hypothetical protein